MSRLKELRNYVLTGLAIFAPVAITIWILYKLFTWLDGILGNMIKNSIHIAIPGVGLIALIALLGFIGMLAKTYFMNKSLDMWRMILKKVPIAEKIYSTSKDVSDAMFGKTRQAFSKAVLIEFPRKGIYSIAFLTSEKSSAIIENKLGDSYMHVFYPTTPNPTSGFFLIVRKDDAVILDMPVEEALKLVISGGSSVKVFPTVEEINK
jgi:uncharacterized membrane protein